MPRLRPHRQTELIAAATEEREVAAAVAAMLTQAPMLAAMATCHGATGSLVSRAWSSHASAQVCAVALPGSLAMCATPPSLRDCTLQIVNYEPCATSETPCNLALRQALLER